MPLPPGDFTLSSAAVAKRLNTNERPLTRFSSAWVGPTLVIVMAAVIQLMRGGGLEVITPGSLLILCVLYAAIGSGTISGLCTALIAIAYCAYFYSLPGHLFQFDHASRIRLASLSVLLPTLAVMVGLLRRREQRLQTLTLQEAVLSQSREWLVTTLQSIGDAVIAVDTQRRVTFVNSIAEALIGTTEAQAYLRPLDEVFCIIDATTRQPTACPVDRVLRDGCIAGIPDQTVLLARDGREIPIDDCASPIRNRLGEVWGVVVVFRDVTERKAAELALAKSERLFRATIQQSPLAVLICDPNGNALQINKAWREHYGVDAQQLDNYNLLRDAQFVTLGVQPLLQRVFEGEEIKLPLVEYDPQKNGWTGRRRWIQGFAYAVKDDDGVVTEVVFKIEDLTERQMAQQALRRSEERYHSLISASSQIIWSALPDGVFDDMPMWRAFTGQTRAAVQGWGWLGAVHPDDRDRTAKLWGDAVAAHRTFQTEYRVRRHDGPYRYFSVRGVPVLKRDGSIREWVGACTDITDQKEAEALIAAQTRILELVATGRPASETLVAIAQLPEAQANTRCAVLAFGDDRESVSICAAPSLPPELCEALETSVRCGPLQRTAHESVPIEYEEIQDNPAWAPFADFARQQGLHSCWSMPIAAANGDTLGLFAMFAANARPQPEEQRLLDTSVDLAGIALERSRVERNLFDALAHQGRTAANLSAIIGHINDAVIAVDAGGRFLFVNDVARSIFGVSHTGRSLEEYARLCRLLLPDGKAVEYADHPLACALQGATVQSEWQIERPDGSRIWVLGNSTPVSDAEGNSVGALLTLHDVTAQREAVRELVRANRMKDEFLAIVSHELRTPLTPILGWTSLLRQSMGSDGRADGTIVVQAADSIQRNAELQKRLVNDLLDSSRIMSGKLRIDPQPADLNTVIEIACTSALRIASERSITIDWKVDSAIPRLLFDVERIQQVLMNLLTNAIKFSPENGGVGVASRLDTAGGRAVIDVHDEGEGIDAALLPHIFEVFRQGDSSYTRRHGGMGLGLAISKSLIEMHGGTLGAASPGRGAGATFTITLPLQGEKSS